MCYSNFASRQVIFLIRCLVSVCEMASLLAILLPTCCLSRRNTSCREVVGRKQAVRHTAENDTECLSSLDHLNRCSFQEMPETANIFAYFICDTCDAFKFLNKGY